MILLAALMACPSQDTGPKDTAQPDDTGDTGETGETGETGDTAPPDDDCDGVDDDGDGSVDEDADWTYYRYDRDGDGYGGDREYSCDDEGAVTQYGDCDDTDPTVNPGAVETCDDGVDSDCDGRTDDGATLYYDGDGDGFGDGFKTESCDPVEGYSTAGSDCDPLDASVYPGAPELCDGVDQDCDGLSDEEDTDAAGAASHLMDRDGDGFGDNLGDGCDLVPGDPLPGDCDDEDATVSPAGTEVCDDRDNDCDGDKDEDAADATTWSYDNDGDGHGEPGSDVVRCGPASGYVPGTGDDCDEADRAVHPDATEICLDGEDQDCDGDEGGTLCEQGTVDRADDGSGAAFLAMESADLDGDGVDDVVLVRADSTLLAFGGPWTDGSIDAASWTWTSATPFGSGTSLALADLDADGSASMVVGDPDAGTVVFLEDPLTDTLDAPTSSVEGDGIGTAVSFGSDFDRDGAQDIVIGCATCAPDSSAQGVVSIQTLGTSGSSAFAGDVAELVGDEDERLGELMAVVDVDSDDFPEIFLSSETEGMRMWSGPVVGDLSASSSDREYRVGEPGADYALCIQNVGDVDGDGVDEVGVGQPTGTTSSYHGIASVYGNSSYASLTVYGDTVDVGLGIWVRGADGVLLVGIRDMGTAVFDANAFGSLGLDDALAVMAIEDPDAALAALAAVGDVDGDGVDDAIVPESGPTANRLRWWSGAGW